MFLRRRPSGAHACPPISILKPLKGGDDDLYENLASFARQSYPRFQIVLGAEDPADAALDVARCLQRDHPHVDIAVVAGAEPFGLNPKVTNLASLSRRAHCGTWLVSDSNVRVRPGYLRALAGRLGDPNVGMVTSIFAGTGEASLGALLENLQINSFIAAGMCGAELLTPAACVVGKSMLFRRRDLERVGGWAAVKDILAEDYFLGRRFTRAGMRVVTSPHVIETVNRSWTLDRFLNRHLRWAQIRRRGARWAFAGEPLLNPVLWSALALAAGFPLVAASATVLKIASDALLAHRLGRRSYRLRDLAWIPVKDLVIAGLWAVAAFRRRVWWRGNLRRIGAGTRLLGEPVAAG